MAMITSPGGVVPREIRTADDGGNYWLAWRCRPPASGTEYVVVRDRWDTNTGPLPTRYIEEIRITGIVE